MADNSVLASKNDVAIKEVATEDSDKTYGAAIAGGLGVGAAIGAAAAIG